MKQFSDAPIYDVNYFICNLQFLSSVLCSCSLFSEFNECCITKLSVRCLPSFPRILSTVHEHIPPLTTCGIQTVFSWLADRSVYQLTVTQRRISSGLIRDVLETTCYRLTTPSDMFCLLSPQLYLPDNLSRCHPQCIIFASDFSYKNRRLLNHLLVVYFVHCTGAQRKAKAPLLDKISWNIP